MASHGGVLGLLIALILYSRKTKQHLLKTVDLIAVITGLTLAFIRLGNLMNSEIIGRPTTKAWGFIFERIDDIPRHPAQLYEAIAYFFVTAIMLHLYIKFRHHLQHGSLFGIGAILFFLARFLIEFIKENQVGFEDGMLLNMGQLLSIPYIAVGIGFAIYGIRKTRKSRNANA